MRIAVITVAAGRHEHLRTQRAGLLAGTVQPDRHVIVAMGDRELSTAVPAAGPQALIRYLPANRSRLPLSAARNVGARVALADGAELLVFLDVDCIPGEWLIERYARACAVPHRLASGPVAYLPPPPPGGYRLSELAGSPGHPGRPVPADDEIVPGGDHTLFWSLSFALTASTWKRIGGFCEQYVGYGGEDTDFGQLARRAGVDHVWVGGAWAYHQYHESHDPPLVHVHDIVRNAQIFERRWGWKPMQGWLREFEQRGLVVRGRAVGE